VSLPFAACSARPAGDAQTGADAIARITFLDS
jgi:hypothetical protein